MKLYHISDLHLGRDFNGYNITTDQEYILNKILENIKNNDIKYLLISGDIYDKFNPSNEACNLFDDFLHSLKELNVRTIIISGNHDSKDRLNYLKRFLHHDNIFIYTNIDTLKFDDDKISFMLIPYMHYSELKNIKQEYKEMDEVSIYNDFINDYLISSDGYTKICLCHNFITGGKQSDSERSLSVGGLDSLPKELFKNFDYTALGHLHMIQDLGDNVYYSGSILKYSVSEFNNNNSILEYDTIKKCVNRIELLPLKGYRTIKGMYEEIFENAKVDPNKENDYVSITLTDKSVILNPFLELSKYYPYIVSFKYEFQDNDIKSIKEIKSTIYEDPVSVFCRHYQFLTGNDANEEEINLIKETLDEIGKEGDNE